MQKRAERTWRTTFLPKQCVPEDALKVSSQGIKQPELHPNNSLLSIRYLITRCQKLTKVPSRLFPQRFSSIHGCRVRDIRCRREAKAQNNLRAAFTLLKKKKKKVACVSNIYYYVISGSYNKWCQWRFRVPSSRFRHVGIRKLQNSELVWLRLMYNSCQLS